MHPTAPSAGTDDPANISLECPATVRARGVSANAIVEHITASACRLRTVVQFEVNAELAFDFGMPGHTVSLRGRVAGRVSAGPRFIYRLALEPMDADRADALLNALDEWHLHQDLANVTERSVDAGDALTRLHKRVPTQFPVSFRLPQEGPKEGRASDISNGGLSISCAEPLIDGMKIELEFTPPSDVLAFVPETVSNRPFASVSVRARVAWHRVVGHKYYTYGLAFVELTDTARHEIARYVQAMQFFKQQIR